MKKRSLLPTAKKTAKSALAFSLAAAMVVPGGVAYAAGDETDESVTVPEPFKVIDFNEGLQELMNDDDNFSITKSEEVYVQKTADEYQGGNEKVDANGIVYTGTGDDTHYHKTVVSNQPTTFFDEEKGTVLKIGKTHVIPAITKTKSADVKGADGTTDAEATAVLDEEIPVAASGSATVQDKYIANSEIVLSNPFGTEELAKELDEFADRGGEYYEPNLADKTMGKFGSKYQPIWNKGVTLSYWIKVPTDESGKYLPSSALRWELDDQNYYQADDYAKYLASSNWFVEKKNWNQAYYDAAAKEESKTVYGSMYYFKYLEVQEGVTDESGAPVAAEYVGSGGNAGPVYDSRFMKETKGITFSKYFEFNPNYKQGYYRMSDGSYEAIYESAYFDKNNSLWLPEAELREKFDIPESESVVETVVKDGISTTVGKVYTDEEGHRYSTTSQVRRAKVDGELQIDVDNSIFWVPDNNLGINQNPNHKASYGSKGGMNNGDLFFMNSWQESQEADKEKNNSGTYQSALSPALSPVTSMDENGIGVLNGNADKWHQVTVTMQNDWVEFYVDGVCVDVNNTYSSRGALSLDNSKSFKRLNYGTGLRYGWGSEKGAGNLKYGNYVCRLFMDWLTDEESTLHIGGAGQYAREYNQATTSNEFSIDDIKFYGELLTEEQIVAAYDAEVAAMNAPADVTGTAVGTAVTDISVKIDNAVTVTKASVEGKTMDVINIAANTKTSTNSGGKMANPFAGKDLEGATIAYWVKQEDKDRVSTLSFMDEEKFVYDPKNDGGEAQSILYINNSGEATFAEGYSSTEVLQKLKNTFTTSSDTTGAAVVSKTTSDDWAYITVTMNNAGMSYYVNGELVENKYTDKGIRFLDGYYKRIQDEADITTRYGAFGGTNNQCATTLMGFLTADDTEMYLGYYPSSGGMSQNRTSACSFAGIKTVDECLTADEVKVLYANRLAGAEEEKPSVKPGDYDGDGTVELSDAQAILRAALLLSADTLETHPAMDADGDGTLTLGDAQKALRFALLLE